MTRRSVAALLLLLLPLVPGRLTAQGEVAALRAGPAQYASSARLMPAAVPAVTEAVVAAPRNRRQQGVILMIVGAAGIVTGIVVDEPIITIASAAVGGFGLYMYLDSGGQVGMQLPIP